MKSKGEALEAQEWTTEYVNSLPDSAFAWIHPDYRSGKSEDKNLRKLPHHNLEGKVDREHVVAAIQALAGARGGVDIPQSDFAEVKRHLCAHARELEIESEFCGLEREGGSGLKEGESKLSEEERCKIAELEASLKAKDTVIEDLKARVASMEEEKHMAKIAEVVELREKAGLIEAKDRGAEVERLKKLDASALDLLKADLTGIVARIMAFGPKAKYSAEDEAKKVFDAENRVRMEMYGYMRDKDGKIVGG